MMTDRRQRKSLGSLFAAMLCQYLVGYTFFSITGIASERENR